MCGHSVGRNVAAGQEHAADTLLSSTGHGTRIILSTYLGVKRNDCGWKQRKPMSKASAGLRERSSSSIGDITLDCFLAGLLLKSVEPTCLLSVVKVCDITTRPNLINILGIRAGALA